MQDEVTLETIKSGCLKASEDAGTRLKERNASSKKLAY